MPTVIPIRDLQQTAKIDQLCQETPEPIIVTKNGYGRLAIMNLDVLEDLLASQLEADLRLAESEYAAGKYRSAQDVFADLEAKYHG